MGLTAHGGQVDDARSRLSIVRGFRSPPLSTAPGQYRGATDDHNYPDPVLSRLPVCHAIHGFHQRGVEALQPPHLWPAHQPPDLRRWLWRLASPQGRRTARPVGGTEESLWSGADI